MYIHNKKFFFNRDVVFQEQVFPFAGSQPAPKISDSQTSTAIDVDFFEACPDDRAATDVLLSSEVLVQDTPATELPEAPLEAISDMLQTDEGSPAPPREQSMSPPLEMPIRKTTRVNKQPVWMKDYATPSTSHGSRYSMANHLSYDHTIPAYHSYLAKFSTLMEP